MIILSDEYMRSHPGLIYQQDNSGPHRARDTQAELRTRGNPVMEWYPSSRDLNAIETVWRQIMQRIRCRTE